MSTKQMKQRYVQEMARTTMPAFNALMNMPRLEERREDPGAKASELMRSLLFAGKILQDKNAEKLFRQLTRCAFDKMKEGDLIMAMRLLKELARAYLNDNKQTISSELGEQRIMEARLIARTWFLAAASEMCRNDMSVFEGYFRNVEIGSGVITSYGESSRFPFMLLSAPVAALGLTGEIADLIPLGIVAEDCGFSTLEMFSTQAVSNIKLRAVVNFALSRWDEKTRIELGISEIRLTDSQFAHRLKFIMDELGLAPILSMLPSMQVFGQCAYSPIDRLGTISQISQITEAGLGKELSLSPDLIIESNSSDHEGYVSARDWLLLKQFVSRIVAKVPLRYLLTEKGEQLIRAVLNEVGKAEFGEKQEEICGGPHLQLPQPRS